MVSVLEAMKDYKNNPYKLGNFIGKQFEIVEDQPISKQLRSTKIKSEKDGSMYEVFLIRVSDGLFEKDLALTKTQLPIVMRCLPKEITNLKGVTIAEDRGTYQFISQSTAGLNENFPANKPQDAPGHPATTSLNQSDLCRQLSHAIELNAKMGIKTDREVMNKMADAISPGKGLDLIVAAKTEGWIYEKDGIFRGE